MLCHSLSALVGPNVVCSVMYSLINYNALVLMLVQMFPTENTLHTSSDAQKYSLFQLCECVT